MANNSITNVSGDMGGISGGAPCGPYAKNGAMLSVAFSPVATQTNSVTHL